jgi:hypothetical protein
MQQNKIVDNMYAISSVPFSKIEVIILTNQGFLKEHYESVSYIDYKLHIPNTNIVIIALMNSIKINRLRNNTGNHIVPTTKSLHSSNKSALDPHWPSHQASKAATPCELYRSLYGPDFWRLGLDFLHVPPSTNPTIVFVANLSMARLVFMGGWIFFGHLEGWYPRRHHL